MSKSTPQNPVSDVLRGAIVKSGIPFQALERETGVARGSISRFVAGKRTLRLDMADRLAGYFGLALREDGRGRRGEETP
jgi:plasmid maintenance system antidote protein VapI